jgi:hypothetical protein
VTDDTPTAAGVPLEGSPASADASSVPERAARVANERPEVAVGAAFGGGLLLALILKRLAR